jgi:ATP-binding cassette, subfamily B, bacterial PglK
VHPPSRFGNLAFDGDSVTDFYEKNARESWINGGYFLLEPAAIDYVERRRRRLGAGAARGPGAGRPAHGVPPPRVLVVHGHAQGEERCSRTCGATAGHQAPWRIWGLLVLRMFGPTALTGTSGASSFQHVEPRTSTMTKPTTRGEPTPALPDDMSLAKGMRYLLELMSPAERRQLWRLAPVMALNAVAQIVGITSVMPFLALIASPDAIEEQALLRWAYDALGFQSPTAFLIAVGMGVLAALVFSNAFAALTNWLLLRFSWNLNLTLSVRMLRTYLAKPYVFFLNRNSSELAKNILAEVQQVVSGYAVAAVNVLSLVVVAVFIVGLLVAVEPLLSLTAFGILGGAYAGVLQLLQRGMRERGRRRKEANQTRFTVALEALTGIKEIKLLGKERPILRRFLEPSRAYVRALVRQQVLNMLPRYLFETIVVAGIVAVVLALLARGAAITEVLPTLGVFAFASYRLLPVLQSIFGRLNDMRFSLAAIEVLHRDLERGGGTRPLDREDVTPLPFRRSLELRGIGFSYPNAPQPVFADLDLTIPANTSVAFVGPTGAGKTTIIDLLLGLLSPQVGKLAVDGVAIDADNLNAWQRNLGYVPQAIHLSDDTVAANIAFGVPQEQIDMAALELAARRAQIHDFIVTELVDGYDTVIGDRGIRLSGGQRQRLGIARALYHDPDVLVLDEATSALDSVTEESIFQAVNEVGRHKTVVMVAHRISTVRDCDTIFVLERGRVVAHGSYDQLLAHSAEFRALARVQPAPPSIDVPVA